MTSSEKTDIPARNTAEPDHAGTPRAKDLRPARSRDDRSAHRAHAWLYEDLLA